MRLSVMVENECGEKLRTLAFQKRITKSKIVRKALDLYFKTTDKKYIQNEQPEAVSNESS